MHEHEVAEQLRALPEEERQSVLNGKGGAEGDDPIAALVSLLDDLPENAPLAKIEAALRNLALTLDGSDSLRRATVREAALRKLGKIGISAPARLLDAALESGGPETSQQQGRPVLFDDPEPWLDPVDGAALLDDLVTMLKRFVILPGRAAEAVALWIIHAHALDAFAISPLLTINSATKRSGKTLLLEVVSLLVPRRLFGSNISPSALFRAVDKFTPCLLIDEADTFLRDNDELRGILNASHRKASAFVVRNVGDDHEPTHFVTWSAKAIALIGKLPGTLEDRSILISMKRKAPREAVEMFRADRVALQFTDLKRKALRWAEDNVDLLRKADPKTPDTLNDRAADNWRPLLAIADVAGREWPERSRTAAKALCGAVDEGENSATIQLLSDLRDLFKEKGERLTSSEICECLAKMKERPWPEWKRGKPITERQLARLLEPFGIRPGQLWVSDKNLRGYEQKAFEDTFSRYPSPTDPLGLLGPAPRAEERPIPDPLGGGGSSGPETARKPVPEADSSTLADQKPLFPEGRKVWTQEV